MHADHIDRPMRSLSRDAVLAALALGASLGLPLTVAASGWLPADPSALYTIAALAWAAALALAATHSSDNVSRLAAVLVAVLAGAQFAARILPHPAAIAGDVDGLASWLWRLVADDGPTPAFPLSASAGHLYWETRGLLERLWLWGYHLRQGTPSTDNTALLFATAVGAWLLAHNATHELVARQRAFAGLLPLAAAVGANVYLARLSDAYVYAYLGILVAALVWANVSHLERRWVRSGLWPRRTHRPATVGAGVLLGAAALVGALAAPNATYAWTFYTFWQEHGARVEAFYRRLDDAFAGRNPITRRAEAQASVVKIDVIEVPVTPTPDLASPPAHTIGAGVDLGHEPVMWVTLDAPSGGAMNPKGGPAKYYWRERTYDTYTGQGWDNGPTEATLLAAGMPWTSIEGPRRPLTQTYTPVRPSAYAFGVNEPSALSAEAMLVSRGPGDLVALSVSADSYTVVSQVPDATTAELRAAEGEYPPWVRERYIPLPPIPERVRDQAYRIVSAAGATTRYDKARAIEAFLRGLAYDLEVPATPPGADAVDHFLFETGAGFCDHSASAMTVMLRAVGVAARYASGYGMGTYQPEVDAWLVTRANAHAWAEVYFPGLGWIEFEPTPIESTFQRPEARATPGSTAAPPAVPTPPPDETTNVPSGSDAEGVLATLRRFVRRYPWLAALAGAALLWVVAAQRPRWLPGNGHSPREEVLRAYRRFDLVARGLGVDTRGATPREALRRLEAELRPRFGPQVDVSGLASLYERARYGSAPVTWSDASDAAALWQRARRGILSRAWRLTGRAPASQRPAGRP